MDVYVIIICVFLWSCVTGNGHLSSRDSRARRRVGRLGRDGVEEAGYCQLAVTCRDDHLGAVNLSSPAKLPSRGRRGPAGRKGDRGLPGPHGNNNIHLTTAVIRVTGYCNRSCVCARVSRWINHSLISVTPRTLVIK